MDKIASTLLAFPPGANLNCFGDNASYNANVKTHVTNLSKLLQDRNADMIIHGPDLLELLDPAINSLSYLAVLHTLVIPGVAASAPRDLILEKLVLFLVTFDARQCRYARSHLHDIFFAAGNGQYLPPSAAVEALATAILRLDPTGSLLTTSHILLAKLAYNTDNIEPALPVIDKNIVFFPGMANYGEPKYLCDLTLPPPVYLSRETGLTGVLKSSLVLEYDLLRGMMYCSRRDWAKAYDAFERVVAFPTREGGTSKIMAEAYKKWMLVSLLSKGKLVDPPPYTGAAANKLYGSLGKPYQAVAMLFVTDDVQALKTEVEKNNQLWSEDGNTGLVQEVLAAYQKWRVLGLERIYSKISLPEIRQQTTSAETGKVLENDEDVETLIQNMIISGMLNGVVEKNDDGTNFLTFLSPSTLLSEEDFASELASTALRLKQLHSFFKLTRERLGTSKEYIKHIIKEEKRAEKNEPDPTLGFDAQVDDEDLMGGIVATG
ncbi:uncharacterized protein F4807DRAFT_452292 [Annulohypoxylon truncatum]|uniref:uncharacterized protein n=1 Tax=Annulohypoxylon truncatum TaxID=327061 RepID=UPI00200726A7|nr:uncharacterized protein F4807DRAFT_452292 [Annulohypoxylon truncatum]KAI1208688.1 hypothetical protein F4807DRAFT_452292 [Annulohypoxylon truncatum]